MAHAPVFAVFTLVCSISLSSCDGKTIEHKTSHSSSSSSSMISSGNGYQVTMSEKSNDGDCQATMVIQGNGIHKTIDFPCPKKPQQVINLNQTLLVGDQEEGYYSDQEAVLVHLTKGKCEQEDFKKKDGKFTSEEKPMSAEDCQKVKDKIEVLKQQQREWMEWMAAQQQEAQHQLEQAQHNLEALQEYLGVNFNWK